MLSALIARSASDDRLLRCRFCACAAFRRASSGLDPIVLTFRSPSAFITIRMSGLISSSLTTFASPRSSGKNSTSTDTSLAARNGFSENAVSSAILRPADLDRHAPSHLCLYRSDFDAAAKRVAHARKYSFLVVGDDRTQVEVCVCGKPDCDQHHARQLQCRMMSSILRTPRD